MGALEDDLDYALKQFRQANRESHELVDSAAAWDAQACAKCHVRGASSLMMKACPGSEQDKKNQEMYRQQRENADRYKPGPRQATPYPPAPLAFEKAFPYRPGEVIEHNGIEYELHQSMQSAPMVVKPAESHMLVPVRPGSYFRVVTVDGVPRYEEVTQQVEGWERVYHELDDVLVNEFVPLDYDTPGATKKAILQVMTGCVREALDPVISMEAAAAQHLAQVVEKELNEVEGSIALQEALEEFKGVWKGLERHTEHPHVMDRLQRIVQAWALRCFGAEETLSTVHRGIRHSEEWIELFQVLKLSQSLGVPSAVLHEMVDHIYSKDPGDPEQELGGVMVTAFTLAASMNVDLLAMAVREVRRILSKPDDHFRARNAKKNALGFKGTDE